MRSPARSASACPPRSSGLPGGPGPSRITRAAGRAARCPARCRPSSSVGVVPSAAIDTGSGALIRGVRRAFLLRRIAARAVPHAHRRSETMPAPLRRRDAAASADAGGFAAVEIEIARALSAIAGIGFVRLVDRRVAFGNVAAGAFILQRRRIVLAIAHATDALEVASAIKGIRTLLLAFPSFTEESRAAIGVIGARLVIIFSVAVVAAIHRSIFLLAIGSAARPVLAVVAALVALLRRLDDSIVAHGRHHLACAVLLAIRLDARQARVQAARHGARRGRGGTRKAARNAIPATFAHIVAARLVACRQVRAVGRSGLPAQQPAPRNTNANASGQYRQKQAMTKRLLHGPDSNMGGYNKKSTLKICLLEAIY